MDKQIEEMVEVMRNWAYRNGMLWHEGHAKLLAEVLVENNYGKIPENAVVIPKEISCYGNVEERIRTFNLDGNKVDFTDEQIMAITSIFHHKGLREKETRKETAEKFAERLKASGEIIALTVIGKGEIVEAVLKRIDEICKGFTEG